MNFSEYSPLALRTAKPLTPEQNLKHAAILMISEAGEIADAVKAHVIYGKPLDYVNIVEEVGDVLWGLNLYLTAKGFDIKRVDEVASLYYEYKPKPIADAWELADLAISVGVFSSTIAVKHLGEDDLLYHSVSALCRALLRLLDYTGYTFEQALRTNLLKLVKRYGDKYSDVRAIGRDLASERAVLEQRNEQTV